MPTCPNGHQSVAEDWCEVCGHRMLAPAAVPPPQAPPGYPDRHQGRLLYPSDAASDESSN